MTPAVSLACWPREEAVSWTDLVALEIVSWAELVVAEVSSESFWDVDLLSPGL